MPIALLEIHPLRGRTLQLSGGEVIGRGAGCAVHLDDPLVSRRHARVLDSELGTAIEDLGSSNGLYINGRRGDGVSPLHPGDVVQVGGTLWLVQRA